jgi:AraC-like DNA-binding protein
MATNKEADSVSFYRPPLLAGVELVSVCYRERSFPEHSHAEYVVGAVAAGAEVLTVGRRSHRVDPRHVLQLHPDEAHANATVGQEALRYRVLYLSSDVVGRLLDERRDALPLRFKSPVSGDPILFQAVNAAHAALGSETSGLLEQESALAGLVRTLAKDTAPATICPQIVQSASVATAKAYVDEHYAEAFGLQDLADLTGLSVFHFARSFKKAVGLSPLAYRNQRRLTEARSRLLDGQAIAQVAIDVGYADQSHLTRHFQRIVGISPRRYVQQ